MRTIHDVTSKDSMLFQEYDTCCYMCFMSMIHAITVLHVDCMLFHEYDTWWYRAVGIGGGGLYCFDYTKTKKLNQKSAYLQLTVSVLGQFIVKMTGKLYKMI